MKRPLKCCPRQGEKLLQNLPECLWLYSQYSVRATKNGMVERIEQLEVPLAHVIPEMTSNLLVPIAIIVYLFVLDWRMALVSLITILLE